MREGPNVVSVCTYENGEVVCKQRRHWNKVLREFRDGHLANLRVGPNQRCESFHYNNKEQRRNGVSLTHRSLQCNGGRKMVVEHNVRGGGLMEEANPAQHPLASFCHPRDWEDDHSRRHSDRCAVIFLAPHQVPQLFEGRYDIAAISRWQRGTVLVVIIIIVDDFHRIALVAVAALVVAGNRAVAAIAGAFVEKSAIGVLASVGVAVGGTVPFGLARGYEAAAHILVAAWPVAVVDDGFPGPAAAPGIPAVLGLGVGTVAVVAVVRDVAVAVPLARANVVVFGAHRSIGAAVAPCPGHVDGRTIADFGTECPGPEPSECGAAQDPVAGSGMATPTPFPYGCVAPGTAAGRSSTIRGPHPWGGVTGEGGAAGTAFPPQGGGVGRSAGVVVAGPLALRGPGDEPGRPGVGVSPAAGPGPSAPASLPYVCEFGNVDGFCPPLGTEAGHSGGLHVAAPPATPGPSTDPVGPGVAVTPAPRHPLALWGALAVGAGWPDLGASPSAAPGPAAPARLPWALVYTGEGGVGAAYLPQGTSVDHNPPSQEGRPEGLANLCLGQSKAGGQPVPIEEPSKASIMAAEVVAAGTEVSKMMALCRKALDQFAIKQLEDVMELSRKGEIRPEVTECTIDVNIQQLREALAAEERKKEELARKHEQKLRREHKVKEIGQVIGTEGKEQIDMTQTLYHIMTYLTFLEEKIDEQQNQLDEIVVGLRTITNIVKGKHPVEGEEEVKEEKKEVKKLMSDAMKSADPHDQKLSTGGGKSSNGGGSSPPSSPPNTPPATPPSSPPPKSLQGAEKQILWRQKRQDHNLVVFDDDTVEKWPLEVEGVASSSDSGKGEVIAAVVNKGGPRPPVKKKKPCSFPEHLGIAVGKPWEKMGLSHETWQERMDNAQCLCGTPGHVIAWCPLIRNPKASRQ
ncbi:hypothetical protein CBR_g19378 [Chara braunii]|uniref:Uncharacterized protein n=1 Tax=Chara braunii TaxID=69332 RepID=A0A388KXT8_CHABU|nr:hypothetical protein CBR_g19378 [Chara braunii]|eukprot:GBG74865.1 hypothetical protein CBR_g19378 [Chara braunii]